jgi:hypothetical protein
LQRKAVAPDITEAVVTLQLSFRDAILRSGHSPASLALAFATVLGDMLLQAGDGHRHSHRQVPLFGRRYVSEPNQPPHPIARLDELAFEPSMFRTTYRQGRSRIHHAPVENREPQIIIKANKKQTLFPPYVRPGWRIPSFTVDPGNLPALDGFEVGEAIGNQRRIIPAI